VAIAPNGSVLATGWRKSSGTSGRALLARFDDLGGLDPTFAAAGIAELSAGPSWSSASDLLIEPDGATIIVGTAGTGLQDFDFLIARICP
jgi:hypothetical protein